MYNGILCLTDILLKKYQFQANGKISHVFMTNYIIGDRAFICFCQARKAGGVNIYSFNTVNCLSLVYQ